MYCCFIHKKNTYTAEPEDSTDDARVQTCIKAPIIMFEPVEQKIVTLNSINKKLKDSFVIFFFSYKGEEK